MTTDPYRRADLPTDQAAQAALTADLVPWREAAHLAHVKPRTLARWIDRGKVPTINIDGRRYVSLEHVSAAEQATRHRRRK